MHRHHGRSRYRGAAAGSDAWLPPTPVENGERTTTRVQLGNRRRRRWNACKS